MDVIVLQRDLRLLDNPALYYGSKKENYCVVYVYDKNYWQSYGRSPRQLKFAVDCLKELNKNLKKLNSKVLIFEGSFEKLSIFLNKELPHSKIHLNHCTDNLYHREDLKKFLNNFESEAVAIYDNFGLQLHQFDRDNWSNDWNKIMNKPLLGLPSNTNFANKLPLLSFEDFEQSLKINNSSLNNIQKGGEKLASVLLNSFFEYRADGYSKKMSCPKEAETACSRLSPHIAFGSISIRKIYQELNNVLVFSPYKKDLLSFKKRLHWHCHFVQKLHTEPELEFNSMHRMCDSLRTDHNNEIIEKWIKGETGFPFLDACMKFLDKHGWINFRMRAMIMSFASYNMWQPWQKTSPLLAELFTDYEPGIHISQVQMQSGVTGINLPRIYSVPKQSMDQDPNSEWTKNILPQLDNIEPKFIHNAELNGAYIPQIVDLKTSAKFARDKIWGIRKSKEFKEEAKRVYLKHGSRRKRNVKTN